MYCINLRRSSIGVDYDRSRSNGQQTDLYKKVKSHLKDCGGNSNRRNDVVSAKICQSGQGPTVLDDEEMYRFNRNVQEKAKRMMSRNHISIMNEMLPGAESESEQREQATENPSNFSIPPIPLEKYDSSTIKATGFEKSYENWQFERAGRSQGSPERGEEKKDDFLDFDSLAKSELDGHLGWSCQFPSFSDTREPSMRKDEVSFDKTQVSSRELSDQGLKNRLEQFRTQLEIERNKNRELQYKLQITENKLKTIERYKIEEGVKNFYRKALQGEIKKREEAEDKLQKSQEEKQLYEEQIDALIFEYIPNAAPKFKDIGPVDYEVNESFDSVGWYQLGEKLGEGYYGSVRRGLRANRDEKYAVKILKKTNINRFKDLKQIAEEIHVLKTYPHPNIIHLEEVVHAADNIYMVTELCFMDLHKYNSETGLTMESARQVVYGILHPLHHLHFHGICHLDLKPENILLKNSLLPHNASYKDVRLCDFGLVTMAKKSDKSKEVIREGYACGTPGFFAPEMVLQEKFEGRTADMVRAIAWQCTFKHFLLFRLFLLLSFTDTDNTFRFLLKWSLGCIILEITLGFTQEWLDSYDRADDNPAKFQRVLQSCLNEINSRQYPNHPQLLDLIHSCLSIDPSKRITSERALSHPWLKKCTSPRR